LAKNFFLQVTKELRTYNFKGNVFVEFFGPGVKDLSVSDRSAISNMCAEYGALIGFFPMDELTMEYLSFTGREKLQLRCIETYMKKVHLFRDSEKPNGCKYHQIVNIDFSSVIPSISGPQNSSERVPIGMVAQQFRTLMQSRYDFVPLQRT
jgi:aconitase A